MRFGEALAQAALELRQAGEIGPLQYWMITEVVEGHPWLLRRIKRRVEQECQCRGENVDPAPTADWGNFLEMLRDLIPEIISLIEFLMSLFDRDRR